jgi:hypothetical protein
MLYHLLLVCQLPSSCPILMSCLMQLSNHLLLVCLMPMLFHQQLQRLGRPVWLAQPIPLVYRL